MSKTAKKMDPRQRQFEFSFEERVDQYIDKRIEIENEIEEVVSRGPKQLRAAENEFERCIEQAAAVKRAIRSSGLSREQVVDGINEYFGRTEEGAKADPPTCRNPLTINYFQKYLTKPHEAPIPFYYIEAIQYVCDSLEPAKELVAPAGAQVISGPETRQLTLGKIEENLLQMRKLRKEIRGK